MSPALTPRQAAKQYMAAGWSLCAIAPGTKSPKYPQWEQRPLRLEQINGQGLGLLHVPSRTCAIDFDNLQESSTWLDAKGIDLDVLLGANDAVQIKSGKENRGKLLYRLPPGVSPLPTRKQKTQDGASMIEFRCASNEGASVQDVLPPTIHPDTNKPYQWGGAGDFNKLPELPHHLLALWQSLSHLEPSKTTGGATNGTIAEGGRNDALYKKAGDMARLRLSATVIEAALQKLNSEQCRPPLPRSEVATIAKSASVTSQGAKDAAAVTNWPEPTPLIAQIEPQAYPVDALPPAVRCAVQEVAGFVKAPIPLIATSALAALSLAIQAHVDVQRADKLHGPCSLFLLAIADSGERKSTCDGFFTKAIRDYEAEQYEAAKPLTTAYKSAMEVWEAQRSGLREKIKALAKDGKSDTAQAQELHDLVKKKPVVPRFPRLIYGDVTPEEQAHALAMQWPSGGVISSEAGTVFGGHAMGKDSVMRNLALLNQLWEGATLYVDRRSTDSFTVRGARLTMALQVQEATVRAFFDNSKGLARGTGFLARFLISWPASTQGYRPFTEAPANWPALAAFNSRLTLILNRPAPIDENGALTPAMLALAPDAKTAWVAFHDSIEAMLPTGGELYDVRDVASKTADNAARLAALFHTFNGSIGPIGLDALESAASITAWHLSEARRFLGELVMPLELANPARLESWMLDYCKRENTDSVPTRQIQQFGPGGLRDRAASTEAVKELAELGRARLVLDGKKRTVQINPALLAGAL